MSKTEALPGVDEYVQDLGAATDNQRMTAHIFCGVCWPGEVPMGTPSLCGVKVLGVPAKKSDCADCKRKQASHAMQHMYNGGSRG